MPSRLLSNLTIVVVEDHDDSRQALGLYLNLSGANVVLARNAAEGLDAIKKNRPDLVLSDIQIPGVDGFELLREIRAFGAECGWTVPVVAMSGLRTSADRAEILGAGFQAFLPKPFSPARLVETILKVLAN